MGKEVILSDLVLPSRCNQRWQYSGSDSPEDCLDKKHFQDYPHIISYEYNSRGFRDPEWPHSLEELRDAIWCVGDSFTVGLGQPLEHTWPRILETDAGRRCINVSMDGASNDWIYRRVRDIVDDVRPRGMVLMWSYTARRELSDPDLTDEQRRLPSSKSSKEQDLDHWIDLANKVGEIDARIVQCTIPHFDLCLDYNMEQSWQDVKGPEWPICPTTLSDLVDLPDWIQHELTHLHGCYDEMETYLRCADKQAAMLRSDVIRIRENLDWARDHHHFDIVTSQWVVNRIKPFLLHGAV